MSASALCDRTTRKIAEESAWVILSSGTFTSTRDKDLAASNNFTSSFGPSLGVFDMYRSTRNLRDSDTEHPRLARNPPIWLQPDLNLITPFNDQVSPTPNLRDSDIEHPSLARNPPIWLQPDLNLGAPFDNLVSPRPSLRDSDIVHPSRDRMLNPAFNFRASLDDQVPNLGDFNTKYPSLAGILNPDFNSKVPFDVPHLRDSDIEHPSSSRIPFANLSSFSSNLHHAAELEHSSPFDRIPERTHKGLWQFGVEIELIVAPSSKVPRFEDRGPIGYRKYWYDRFQRFLNERDNRQGEGAGLLAAHADPFRNGVYTKYPAGYNKWYITEDESLGLELETKYELPMEISSPILQLTQDWRGSVNSLWSEIQRIFIVKQGKTCCGSHVHISPVGRIFTMPELKNIAKFVLIMEEHIFNLLPLTRRHHQFCKLNSFVSPRLKDLKAGGKSDAVYWQFRLAVDACWNEQGLCHLMQEGYSSSQRTLWNFNNTLGGGKGTVEFRGGRHLQGPERTKAWITLALSLVHLAIYKENEWIVMPYSQAGTSSFDDQMRRFWGMIKQAANELGVHNALPQRWKQMNEMEDWSS